MAWPIVFPYYFPPVRVQDAVRTRTATRKQDSVRDSTST